MKKFLLIMSAGLMATSLYAGDIRLYSGETLLEPGKHIFNEMTITDLGAGVMVTIDPDLSIKADSRTYDVQVTAKCTTGQNIQMCAGGQCERKPEVVKTGLLLNADTPLPLEFEFMETFDSALDIPKDITTELTIEELGVPSSKKLYTILMNTQTGAVEVINHDSEINYMNGALNYNLSGAATINVYDVNGRLVKSAEAQGNGTLPLSDLGKGIYLYSISGSPSGKIIL